MCDRKKAFAVLLFQLSRRLKDEEVAAIILIEDLPKPLEEKGPLEVLIQLQMLGKITESDPSTLQNVFHNLNRMDLVGKVKDFIKSQKKNKKAAKSGGCSESMASDLAANINVSLLQNKVLREQLINVANLANKCGEANMVQIIQEAIRALARDVERNIKCAKQELESKDSSSSLESSGDDDSPQSTLTRHYPSPPQLQQQENKTKLTKGLLRVQQDTPHPTQEENRQQNDKDEDDGVYEVVTNAPRIPFITAASPDDEYCYTSADMVPSNTPATSTPINFISDAKNTPRSVGTPSISLSSRMLRKDLHKPMPPPKPSTPKIQFQYRDDLDSSVDDCSYTGGTGDSGFSESWKYRKPLPRHPSSDSEGDVSKSPPVPAPRPPPKTNSYTKLNVDKVKLSYYKSARENHQRFQDIMLGSPTETETEKEEKDLLYQNFK